MCGCVCVCVCAYVRARAFRSCVGACAWVCVRACVRVRARRDAETTLSKRIQRSFGDVYKNKSFCKKNSKRRARGMGVALYQCSSTRGRLYHNNSDLWRTCRILMSHPLFSAEPCNIWTQTYEKYKRGYKRKFGYFSLKNV